MSTVSIRHPLGAVCVVTERCDEAYGPDVHVPLLCGDDVHFHFHDDVQFHDDDYYDGRVHVLCDDVWQLTHLRLKSHLLPSPPQYQRVWILLLQSWV